MATIQLPNDCYCGKLSVNPKNWKQVGASLKKDWYIHYRFYDPAYKDKPIFKNNKLQTFPKGMLVIVKGMNEFKTLEDRRRETQKILDEELGYLKDGVNPIANSHRPPGSDVIYEISPQTPFISALQQALKRITVKQETRLDIKSVLKYTEIAAVKYRYDKLAISEIKRKHIKLILDEQANLKITDLHGKKDNNIERKWSPKRYNVYLVHLHRLFTELIELEACEYNPVVGISKKIVTHTKREVITKKERHDIINVYLKKNYYPFYRFCQIFFHSGGRIAELLRVQVKDIDFQEQFYKTIIEKGKNRREEERGIKDVALPFWKELTEGAKPEDFIFSYFLKPGPNEIKSAKQITRRWKIHVKDKLGITADIYTLKHANLDDTAAIEGVAAAQHQAGHTTPVITMGRYLQGEKKRQRQRLKGVNNQL